MFNPATQEVIGVVADGDAGDMSHPIAAARAAFDQTAWSTDRELRKRCLARLVVIPYENEDAAVRIANDTRYGLASYVMTGDKERGQALARRMRMAIAV